MRALTPLAVALAMLGCESYEVSDRPICGDRLVPEGAECVLYPSMCGCGEGQRCGYVGDELRCVAPGPKGADEPCVQDEECAAGTVCDASRCRRTCFESLDCGEDRAVLCEVWHSGSTPVAGICHRDCDPLTPRAPFHPRLEACSSTDTCALDPFGVPSCRRLPNGPKPIGGACGETDVCAPGSGCVDGTCRRFCWIEDPTRCPTGTECRGVSTDWGRVVLLDSRTLGACL